MKIARVATGRDAVAVFDHAYHGRTNLTMAMTAKNMPYKKGFGPFAGEVYRVPMSYPFRDGLSGEDAAARAIDIMEKQIGAENLACVVIEPIQGEGGFVVPAPGFLPALSAWATDNGVVFIADEIQTGFCRTGDWFACDDEGVEPDLITLAKGIAGGLPLAAVTGRAELMDSVHVGGLGGTYGGNPVACAARPGRARGDAQPRPRCRAPGELGEEGRRPAAQAAGRPPRDRRCPRSRRDDGDRADLARDAHRRSRRARPRSRRTATSRAWSPSPAAPGATCSGSCRRSRSRTSCWTRRSTWLRRRSPPRHDPARPIT